MQNPLNRRQLLTRAGQAAAAISAAPLAARAVAAPTQEKSDSLAMQLYKSLSDEQRAKICLANDHPQRAHISNWWYIHPKHRLNNTFTEDQLDLIQQLFDSLHHPEHRAAVNKQVKLDQYGNEKNSPSVGFFGSPDDEDFEFIFTGHHVTRRCNPHTADGQSLSGGPLFYGHFFEQFNETKDHPNNPYWYQGKLFNQFVQALDGSQQAAGLAEEDPRSERAKQVIRIREQPPGLDAQSLSDDQQSLLLETIGKMLVMFREDDVQATLAEMKDRNLVDQLHISWYGGKFDIASDKVWDTWTIEGPNLVWYFRGVPHIHSYFHLKS